MKGVLILFCLLAPTANAFEAVEGAKPAVTKRAADFAPEPQLAAAKLQKGQSQIVCASADSDTNVNQAVARLNRLLLKSKNEITVADGSVTIEAPYSVSSPALTSYDHVGSPDQACVTVTKQ